MGNGERTLCSALSLTRPRLLPQWPLGVRITRIMTYRIAMRGVTNGCHWLYLPYPSNFKCVHPQRSAYNDSFCGKQVKHHYSYLYSEPNRTEPNRVYNP